jgi:hypothetical protein
MIPEAFDNKIRTQEDLDEFIDREIEERVGDMPQKPIVYGKLFEEQEKAIKEKQPQPIKGREYQHQI